MASPQGDISGGRMTRKRHQKEEEEKRAREKEENARKARRNTKTSWIAMDLRTKKIKIELDQEEIEQKPEVGIVTNLEEPEVKEMDIDVEEGVVVVKDEPVDKDDGNCVPNQNEHSGASAGQSVEEGTQGEAGNNLVGKVNVTTEESGVVDGSTEKDELQRITEENKEELHLEGGAENPNSAGGTGTEEDEVVSVSEANKPKDFQSSNLPMESEANLVHSRCVPLEVFQRFEKETENRINALEEIVKELQQQKVCKCNSGDLHQTTENQVVVGLEPTVDTEASQELTDENSEKGSDNHMDIEEEMHIPQLPVNLSAGTSFDELHGTTSGINGLVLVPVPDILATSSNGSNSADPEDDRTVRLFSEVVQVMWKKYKYSMVNKSDFLKFRLVCAAWSKGVEDLELGPCQRLTKVRGITVLNGFCCWFDGPLDGYMQMFEYNPDSGITLELGVQPIKLTIEDADGATAETRRNSQSGIRKLLKKHGLQFKEFTYIVNKDLYKIENRSRILYSWLKLMPNLERIQVRNYDDPNGDPVALTPFPTLSKMKHMDSEDWYDSLGLFRTAVMGNPQLSSLVISKDLISLKDVVLPQLRDLSVEVGTYYNYDNIDDRNLSTLPDLHAPFLQKLTLDATPGWCGTVSKALNKFRESLQILDSNIWAEDGFDRVVFPDMIRLRKLTLNFMGIDNPTKDIMRIVSSCPSLEHLVVISSRYNFLGERKEIESQLVSKLWQTVPNLRQVEWHKVSLYKKNTLFFIRKREISS